MWKDKGLQLVMLPTKDKVSDGSLALSRNYELLSLTNSEADVINIADQTYWNPQHLYLLSDEEIKEGDWIYFISIDDEGIESPLIIRKKVGFQHMDSSTEKKVIASTEISLNLPSFPDSSLKEYAKRYNSRKSLEVEVKYTGDESENWYNGDITAVKLHINFNNTISIRFKEEKPCTHKVVEEAMRIVSKDVRTPNISKKEEKMYSRSEVERVVLKFQNDLMNSNHNQHTDIDPIGVNDWIKENLK